MPSEPEESNFKDKVKVKAYPTRERGGVVWTYMGPRPELPPLPDLEANMLPDGQWWKFRSRPHIGPDYTAPLSGRVGFDFDLVLKVALFRFRRHVNTITVNVKLPAVINAPQTALLVSTKEQACSSMRTEVVYEPNFPIRVPKCYQIFTQ
jgi:hypothetical protein